ncbi:MAG TPA: lytic transglycosylase domain-containing protein [Mucilaginibacter sp.]|jgi:membrane-bound lytic murein transglycosylase D|nr:lytic transglycosylase domain-containing protein [Mucilaginibacter sp.]
MKRLLTLTIAVPFLIQVSKANTHVQLRTAGYSGELSIGRKGKHDTASAKVNKPASYSIYRNNIYKKRLDSIQKEVPLDYNEFVQGQIETDLTTGREDISREIGLAKYYFPIYEKAFRDAGIPDEIKYLSIVESQLNPNAVSRMGATGPWQFMSNVARTYGLRMDNYVDERRDPVHSSIAAAAYLKDAYDQFGDWLLAIASYNCGKSEVLDAIDKAGGQLDFWAIRQYLPAQTRDYVPSYIAITYVMNYYKKHHILPQESSLPVKTDTVLVNKFISLNSVSRVLGVNLPQLMVLNPAYTQGIINGSPDEPKVLVIPQYAKDKYSAMYDKLNTDLGYADPRAFDFTSRNADQVIEKRIPVHHRIRKFESMVSLKKATKSIKG